MKKWAPEISWTCTYEEFWFKSGYSRKHQFKVIARTEPHAKMLAYTKLTREYDLNKVNLDLIQATPDPFTS